MMKSLVLLSSLLALGSAAPQRGVGGCGCREVICPNQGPDVGLPSEGRCFWDYTELLDSIVHVLMRRPMTARDINEAIALPHR
jgi:hypothetical protein